LVLQHRQYDAKPEENLKVVLGAFFPEAWTVWLTHREGRGSRTFDLCWAARVLGRGTFGQGWR